MISQVSFSFPSAPSFKPSHISSMKQNTQVSVSFGAHSDEEKKKIVLLLRLLKGLGFKKSIDALLNYRDEKPSNTTEEPPNKN